MKVILPTPRGFCAGVTRAINIVEKVIEKNSDKKIFVFNYIVHNEYIISYFEKKGIVFVQNLDDKRIEKGNIVIFSAHGVSDTIEEQSQKKGLISIDASCPLVKKIHIEVELFAKRGYHIIVVGKKEHPEVVGTVGRIINKNYSVVFSNSDIDNLTKLDNANLYYVVQTTLGVYETKKIIEYLKEKFPKIKGQDLKDICYATKNRQEAINKVIKNYKIDYGIVVGSAMSSNSNSLKKIMLSHGINSILLSKNSEIPIHSLKEKDTILITSGASTPEILIEKLLKKLSQYFYLTVEYFTYTDETTNFKLPKELL
ncbi:4-hydroxy-3-methylbut-2-enyl diphosphate reductase [Anaplasmataceae bacterium AB001_6]|nr:4-hydroxy-3-methylbut-2-enyl diphosphate reductase [Anaplasmataceae bacterium AB001_6]